MIFSGVFNATITVNYWWVSFRINNCETHQGWMFTLLYGLDAHWSSWFQRLWWIPLLVLFTCACRSGAIHVGDRILVVDGVCTAGRSADEVNSMIQANRTQRVVLQLMPINAIRKLAQPFSVTGNVYWRHLFHLFYLLADKLCIAYIKPNFFLLRFIYDMPIIGL